VLVVPSQKLSSIVSSDIQFLLLDLTCFIVANVLSHMHVSKHRVHFQCEIFQFGKSIFAD